MQSEESVATLLPDSMRETIRHIRRVQELMNVVVAKLLERSRVHDVSKLHDPEADVFAVMTHKLKSCEYGSDEYKAFLAEMKPALDHHYMHNSHHPEHHAGGASSMSLLDLLEMLIDWKAAGERHDTGSIQKSLDFNRLRFGYGDELDGILRRTAAELFPRQVSRWHCFGCGNGGAIYYFCEMCGAGRDDYAKS